MEIIGILCKFKLVPEWNASKELPESLRLEFSKKISAKTYALLDAKVINSRSLYRGVIASGSDDFLFYKYKQVWQIQEPFCNNY